MIQVITNTLNDLSSLSLALVGFTLSLSGLAANIAVYLPPPTKPGWYDELHGFINWIGRNVGRAENKE